MSKKIKTVFQTSDNEVHADMTEAKRHQARVDLEEFIEQYTANGQLIISDFIEDIVDNVGHIGSNPAATWANLIKQAK